MPDEHAHAAVEVDESDPQSTPTLLVGAVGMILLMVTVLLVEVLYQRTSQAEVYRKVISEQPLELRQVQAEQLEQLNGYRWVSQPEGVAAIPIDRAIDLIVEETKKGQKPRSRRWQRLWPARSRCWLPCRPRPGSSYL